MQVMDVLAESRPPGIAACDRLHAGHSWMVAVQFSQDSAFKLLGNYHMDSPQQTVTIYCQLHAPGLEWLQIYGDNSWPFSSGVLQHLAENWASSSSLLNLSRFDW